MTLALFDLDNTLLNGDSDHSWGMYLAEIGAVDATKQQQKQDYFYQQYVAGSLDILEFCEFQFKVLSENSLEQLQAWRADFLSSIIQPMIASGKADLLEPHRNKGDDLIIITATNDFITRPIAEMLGVDALIATTAEFNGQGYTGKVAGTPCFQDGKVSRLNEWLLDHGHIGLPDDDSALSDSYFYSDSYNDLALLERVENPIAVTPDERLRQHAKKLHWPIID